MRDANNFFFNGGTIKMRGKSLRKRKTKKGKQIKNVFVVEALLNVSILTAFLLFDTRMQSK